MKSYLALLLLAASSLYGQTRTTVSVEGDQHITGTKTIDNLITSSTPVVDVRAYATGSTTGGIQESITHCAGRCTILVASPITVTSTVNVNQVGVEIVGFGPRAVINVNHALDVFNVTSSLFKLRDLEIDISATAGNRINSSIVVGAAQSGVIDNVRFVGSASVTNNGIIFKSTGNGSTAGIWHIDSNLIPGGVTWQNFALVTNSSAVTTSASYYFSNNSGTGLTVTDALFAFDGFLDTVKLTTNDMAVVSGGPAVSVRNTVSACVECPRWVHLTSNSFEAQGQTVINAASSKDFQITGGYVVSGTTGVALGSSAFGPKIQGVVFSNIGQSAVTISAGTGSYGVRVLDNYFDDQCNSVTNTYDAISVAANSNDFMIRGNVFRDLNANTCAHFLNISGTSDRYMVQGNDFQGTTGTSAVTNTASGSNRSVLGNTPNAAIADSVNNSVALNGAATFNGTTQFNTKPTAAVGIAITAAQPFQMNEGSNPSAIGGADVCGGNSTAHALECSYNAGTFFPMTQTIGTGNVTTAGTAVTNGTSQAQTGITVTGALTTDSCTANLAAALPATWQTGIQFRCDVTASGTVTVNLMNPTAGSITPAATVVNVRVTR
jgi:hypothetical protein